MTSAGAGAAITAASWVSHAGSAKKKTLGRLFTQPSVVSDKAMLSANDRLALGDQLLLPTRPSFSIYSLRKLRATVVGGVAVGWRDSIAVKHWNHDARVAYLTPSRSSAA